jgi:hypothetical protein
MEFTPSFFLLVLSESIEWYNGFDDDTIIIIIMIDNIISHYIIQSDYITWFESSS